MVMQRLAQHSRMREGVQYRSALIPRLVQGVGWQGAERSAAAQWCGGGEDPAGSLNCDICHVHNVKHLVCLLVHVEEFPCL